MAMHEAPDAILTCLEADRLRGRALELVAELDGITADPAGDGADLDRIWRWAGQASVILAELARG